MKHVRQIFRQVCAAVGGAMLLTTNAAATSVWVSDVTIAPRDEQTAFLKSGL
jgi:hypothetical protein